MSTPIVDIEQPQITPETKFRRGGFKPAAEVIAEAGAAPAQSAAQEDSDPEMTAAILADDSITLEFPEGVGMSTTPAATEEVTPEVPAAEAKFKLGGREFATQEEAWAYAEELEQKQLTADAFRQGVEAASKITPGNPAPQPATPPAPTEIDPLYYTDPQAYFAKREAEIIARAETVITTKAQQRTAEQELWGQFYTDYPDLSAAKEFVDLTMQQNWSTLQHVETKQALKQLAEKTRAKLKPIIEARMPKTELPKVKTAASPGGAEQVTMKSQPSKPLNFAQQMKNLKKNRAPLR